MENVPKHIGVVLDGNRRFAKRLMLKPWKGYEWGTKKLEKLLEWCREYGIKETTFYAFSLKNFNRPKEEFDYLMDLFNKEFDNLKDDPRIYKNKIKINVIGRINLFPKEVQEKMREIMEKTKKHNKYIINFAMAYDGRAEIIDATKKIAKQIKEGKLDIDQINEEIIDKSVYMSSKPDLIIRTSGEHRTSGFLLWQGDYAEWFFCDKFWPEFEKEDFIQALKSYSKRERRFGK